MNPSGDALALAWGPRDAKLPLRLVPDVVNPVPTAQWIFQSNADGFFQIRSATGIASLVLDGSNINDTVAAPATGAPAQEWNITSLSNGVFQIVNRASGQPVTLQAHVVSFRITPTLR